MSSVDGETLDEGKNTALCAKTKLNTFCQRALRRSLSKADIVYVVVKFGQSHQAIVELPCLGGIAVAGKPQPSHRDAIQSAACLALSDAALASWVVDESVPQTKLRAAASSDGKDSDSHSSSQNVGEKKSNPSLTPKVALNSLITMIARTSLAKGDTEYIVTQAQGGVQASVRIKVLIGKWKDVMWTGQVCTTKRQAEQSAAEVALESLLQDEAIMQKTGHRWPMGYTGMTAAPPWPMFPENFKGTEQVTNERSQMGALIAV